ncbi:MAG: hypothetical protein SGPRY_005013 [Prymnesium sp.]
MYAILVTAFRRRLNRLWLGRLIAGWREFTRHGTVETRTRSQLLASLRVQEKLTLSLEGTLAEYSAVLEEAEGALTSEAKSQRELRQQKEELLEKLMQAELAKHAAEHEAVSLRGALRAYEIRYPRAFSEERGRREMSEPPLVVDKPAMETLIRLKQTAQVLTSEQRYALPPSGGSGAERELRRVRALLDYVVRGELPKKSTLEVKQVAQEVKQQIRRTHEISRVLTLSETLDSVGPLSSSLPPPSSLQLRSGDASEGPTAGVGDEGEAAGEVPEGQRGEESGQMGAGEEGWEEGGRAETREDASKAKADAIETEAHAIETEAEARYENEARSEGEQLREGKGEREHGEGDGEIGGEVYSHPSEDAELAENAAEARVESAAEKSGQHSVAESGLTHEGGPAEGVRLEQEEEEEGAHIEKGAEEASESECVQKEAEGVSEESRSEETEAVVEEGNQPDLRAAGTGDASEQAEQEGQPNEMMPVAQRGDESQPQLEL